MFRGTDFGGFLVCCQIGHPHLNDVENNSVAISLMLSLENAQIDWTKREKKNFARAAHFFLINKKNNFARANFTRIFKVFPKMLES